jgi:hypothetical protein
VTLVQKGGAMHGRDTDKGTDATGTFAVFFKLGRRWTGGGGESMDGRRWLGCRC